MMIVIENMILNGLVLLVALIICHSTPHIILYFYL